MDQRLSGESFLSVSAPLRSLAVKSAGMIHHEEHEGHEVGEKINHGGGGEFFLSGKFRVWLIAES